MTITARFRLPLIVLLFLVLPFAGCSSSNEREPLNKTVSAAKRPIGFWTFPTSSSRTFPVPSEIKGNVAFWRNVYGKWSRGEVAIHDDEYMEVIYEVTDLPGPALNGYTAEQKRFVRARKAHYKRRLKDLEHKIRAGLSPSRYDRALYGKLMDAGGKWAIYSASERVRSQRGLRERFRRGLAISGRYDAKFREIFRSRGLPEDLAYLPHVESSFQANAYSSVGAAGIWQFMRGTGRKYMTVNGVVDERLDPVTAAEGAAGYLGAAYRKLGSWPLAVTSYNHGQGGMAKAKAIYGNDIGAIVRKYKGPYFKFASRNFYAEFIAAREVASHPHRYFPEGIRYQASLSEDRLILRHSASMPWIARYYGVSTHRLAGLNLHWKKSVRQGSTKLPTGSTVWLPSGAMKRAEGVPASSNSMMLAKAEYRPKAKRELTRVARTEYERKSVKIAKVRPKQKPVQVAKAKAKQKPVKKVHVVKPNETLYRVSTYYKLPVAELRRLNRMGPKDTNIRPGQRLRVSG